MPLPQLQKNSNKMQTTQDIRDIPIADAWAALKAHAESGTPLTANTSRLAFADPEFLLRRETRGIRFQLEFLKPDLIQQEYGVEKTIVVFGGARFLSPLAAAQRLQEAEASGDTQAIKLAQRHLRTSAYYEKARQFGHIVSGYNAAQKNHAERYFICTGGGPGVMEAANRGAHEAGQASVGLNIVLPHEQNSNPYIPPELNFTFHYFAMRKMHFMMRAKALLAFPGGFGTLDELFEVLTLIQTQKAQPVPVILFGSDYWKRLINFDMLVEEGAISPDDLDLFTYCDDPQSAWDSIKGFYNLT